MKRFTCLSLVAGGLVLVSLITAPKAPAQNGTSDCDDRITSGGWIVTSFGSTANFGVHGGLDPSDPSQLTGNLNYVHKEDLGLHVVAKEVTGYCRCPGKNECRRITYHNAKVTIKGVSLTCDVFVEVCDLGEPPIQDTFSICIPCIGYCQSGVLSGGNIQLHASDPGCPQVPVCEVLHEEACGCLTQCVAN